MITDTRLPTCRAWTGPMMEAAVSGPVCGPRACLLMSCASLAPLALAVSPVKRDNTAHLSEERNFKMRRNWPGREDVLAWGLPGLCDTPALPVPSVLPPGYPSGSPHILHLGPSLQDSGVNAQIPGAAADSLDTVEQTSPGLQAAHSALACSRPGPADVPNASEEERFILYSPRGFYILLSDIRCLALIAVLYTQIPFRDQTSSFKPKWKYFRRQTHY